MAEKATGSRRATSRKRGVGSSASASGDSTAKRAKPTGPAKAPAGGAKPVNLALQGGGAHGAFAWGVLDRLLEEPQIAFEGVSATSAGAMNAAVLAHGLSVGGRDGAKEALDGFWQQVSESADFSPLRPTMLQEMTSDYSAPSPAFVFFDIMTRLVSPYQFNPLNINPLRQVLEDSVDFERVRTACQLKLFISATNVRTGKVRIFRNHEVTLDAVMASGCLPLLFHAVEVQGEAYWDGGYMGNPAIYPLIYHCESRDVVIVHINPLYREEVPVEASAILNRINEISFNSSLMREMRAIAFVTNLIDDEQLHGRAMKRMLIHSIEADEVMRDLGVHTKMTPSWRFLTHLRDLGRRHADAWLAGSLDKVGRESSVDIREKYL